MLAHTLEQSLQQSNIDIISRDVSRSCVLVRTRNKYCSTVIIKAKCNIVMMYLCQNAAESTFKSSYCLMFSITCLQLVHHFAEETSLPITWMSSSGVCDVVNCEQWRMSLKSLPASETIKNCFSYGRILHNYCDSNCSPVTQSVILQLLLLLMLLLYPVRGGQFFVLSWTMFCWL